MGIVCPREPFVSRGWTIQRPRGHPQPPLTYVGMPARKVRNVPAPMTSAGRFSPRGRPGITDLCFTQSDDGVGIMAARSKSLAQMNKTRYRQGVETTKNQSELM